MRWITATILWFTATLACGQVPGYLGKRFTVFLEANPTPALLVQNTNNALILSGDDSYSRKKNAFAFNFRPQAEIDYLITRDFSAGILFGTVMAGTTRAFDAPDGPATVSRHLSPAVIKGYSAGVRLKFFRFRKSATIAPIGLYKTFTIAVNRINVYESLASSQSLVEKDMVKPVISLGVGRQSIIARNVLLKTGIEVGMAIVPFNFLTEADDEWTSGEFTIHQMHRSLFGYHLFSVNVALGYIPF
jgi:hypothetical protein